MGKAILSVIKPDVISSVGKLQPCAGQESGCEAAVHAMKDIFNAQSTDAVLLLDADNAFNSLNRAVLLPNIQYLCPLWLYTYGTVATLHLVCSFLEARKFHHLRTTHGDPLAMPVYAIGIIPIMEAIKSDDRVKHVAFCR